MDTDGWIEKVTKCKGLEVDQLLKTAPEGICGDRAVAMAALRRGCFFAHKVYKVLSEPALSDRDVFMEALRLSSSPHIVLALAPAILRGDSEVAKAALQQADTPDEAINVLEALVEPNGCSKNVDGLEVWAATLLQGFKDFRGFFEAAKNPNQESGLSQTLRRSRNSRSGGAKTQEKKVLELAAFTYTKNALTLAPAEVLADRNVALAALRRDGGALELLSPELRGDRDIVLAAQTGVSSWRR